MSDEAPNSSNANHEEPSRRGFIEIASVVIGAVVGLVPMALGLFTFFDPLRKKRPAPEAYKSDGGGGKAGYFRISSLNALAIGGEPQRFPVIADKRDSWNYIPDQPIGAIFVERTSEKEVRVFNATCPHAGCSVSCNGASFFCPCHNSAFNLDGSKLKSQSGRENPSPRDLDELEVDPDKLAENEIWVEFKNFYTGKHDKIAKS